MATLSRRTETQVARRQAVETSVLAATERLLAQGASYADLAVDRIAREAGISRTAFYFYFRDKRELLMRLTGGVMEELYGLAGAWFGARDGGAAALRAALTRIFTLYRTHGVLLRTMVEASTYDEEIARFWREAIGRFVDAARARIEAEQAAGHATGIAAEPTAFALVWMTERAVYEHLVSGRTDDDALLSGLVGVWTRTIYG